MPKAGFSRRFTKVATNWDIDANKAKDFVRGVNQGPSLSRYWNNLKSAFGGGGNAANTAQAAASKAGAQYASVSPR